MKRLFTGFIFISLFTGCISPELRTARIAVNERDWNRAIKSLDVEIARMPQSAEAWYLRGWCFENLGDWVNMTQAFDRSLGISTQFEEKIKDTRLRLVARYYGRAYAEDSTAHGLIANTQDSLAWNKANELWSAVFACLDTAIIIEPRDVRLYQQAAVMGYNSKHYERAGQYALKAMELEKPGEPEISVREVMLSIAIGKKDDNEIVKWARELMNSVDPQKESDIYLHGYDATLTAYMDQNQIEKAQGITKEVISHFPKHPDVLMNLAILMIKRSDYNSAKQIFSDILAIEPDNFEANLNLGTILVNQDKWLESIVYLDKAYKMQPDNKIAIQNLMAAYFNSGQEPKGKEMKKALDDLGGMK